MAATTTTLHTYKVHHARATTNKLHFLLHFTAVLSLLYYRISHLFHGGVPSLPWCLLTTAELIFTFLWFLSQAFRWGPLTRTAYPEKLSGNSELPRVDVFICTADPKKEPTVEVMNTVLSAMALDYPPEKLAVYLSDDGGSSLTLYAMKAARDFARCWIPFCRKYGIKSRCPDAYFSAFGDEERVLRSDEFRAEEEHIKSAYELFKKNVEKANGRDGIDDSVVNDRPPCVEVIHDNTEDGVKNNYQTKMPLLVYVSREKRPSHPHRFKAGALNALLRVSGIMSNGPYVLVLDCDMYCNDPTSARQSMCFHLDPQMSRSLAFVQYPQVFHNVSKNDIYDGQARSAYMTLWQGMDGLRGPVFTGTGYYLKRKALYQSPDQDDAILQEPKKSFGLSSKFIASLNTYKVQDTNAKGGISDAILEEARNLATCTFEKGTKWGQEIGYSYDSLLESTFTGYLLHCKGWRSVYLYPKRPCFLGCATVDMKDAAVQQMKWSSGLLQIALSRFSPITYGMSRMSILQSMCYGTFTFSPLYTIAFLLYGTIPQLCLLTGIPLYPKVSNPWFAVFASLYVSSICQHLYEVLSSGGSVRTWWNEHRIWMIQSVTGILFGCLDVISKWLGITKANFRLTNKAIDKEKLKKYEKGKFDFQGAEMFMVPLTILVLWNVVCFIGGVKMLVFERNFEEMFVQVFMSSMILVLGYPVLEGLVQSKGRCQLQVSVAVAQVG
ncbi:Cellulose synthase-like protein G1 [Camellia lanceoleosa]|uniref:Cellulose synthase-like protein G1 n=1 Tax=Camellia lanceoleosa TaxID=1840588 RepID=A0ACC0GVK6_9ERIC|nr:Cellulose synthase-like protein G1 [Camellia lanceoleosa]